MTDSIPEDKKYYFREIACINKLKEKINREYIEVLKYTTIINNKKIINYAKCLKNLNFFTYEDEKKIIELPIPNTDEVDDNFEDNDIINLINITADNGNISKINNFSFEYQPKNNFNGLDTIHLDLSVLNSTNIPLTLNIFVISVNDMPIIHDSNYSLNEDQTVIINILENISDTESNPIKIIKVISNIGSKCSIDNNKIIYEPIPNYYGDDTIIYSVYDGTNIAEGIININIVSINDSPIISDTTLEINEDTLTNINLLDYISDVDNNKTSLTISNISSIYGSVNFINNTTISYISKSNYNGPDNINFDIDDGINTISGLINIIVKPVNDIPYLDNNNNNIVINVFEDEPKIINILNYISDIEGDNLYIHNLSADNGIVSINSDQTINYQSNSNYNGEDIIYYSINDGTNIFSSQIKLLVNPINDEPIFNSEPIILFTDSILKYYTLQNITDIDTNSSNLSIDNIFTSKGQISVGNHFTLTYTPPQKCGIDYILFTINDGNHTKDVQLRVSIIDIPSIYLTNNENILIDLLQQYINQPHTQIIKINSNYGNVHKNDDNLNLLYEPDNNFNGIDFINLTLANKYFEIETSIRIISIVNNNKFTHNIELYAINGILKEINVFDFINSEQISLENNLDDNDISFIDSISKDNFYIHTVESENDNSVTINQNNNIIFFSENNTNTFDNITYVISNDTIPYQGVIKIHILDLSNVPFAQNDNISTQEDTPININILDNDIYNSVPETILSITVNSDNGTTVINQNNTITYHPNLNFFGTDKITYQISTNNNISTADVFINVLPINDILNTVYDIYEININNPITIDLLKNINYPDNEKHKILIDNIYSHNGIINIIDNNTIVYTPNNNYYGMDSIIFSITNGHQILRGIIDIRIKFSLVDIFAPNKHFTINEDTSTIIEIFDNNNLFPPKIVQSLNIINIVTSNGVTEYLSNTKSLKFTPTHNFHGTSEITYSITDGESYSQGSILIQVENVTDIPVSSQILDMIILDEDTTFDFNILDKINYPDNDGTTLRVLSISANNGRIITNNSTSKKNFTYIPNKNFNGNDIITYIVTNDTYDSQGIIEVTVNSIIDIETIKDYKINLDEDTTIYIDILSNDIYPDDDKNKLFISEVSNLINEALVSIKPNNIIEYKTKPNYNGTDTITYTISNGNLFNQGKIDLNILPVNDIPIGIKPSDPFQINEDNLPLHDSLIIPVISQYINYPDNEINNLYIKNAFAINGQVKIMNNNSSLEYCPNNNFNGNDKIYYIVSNSITDSQGEFDIIVNPILDIPIAMDDELQMLEDETIVIDVLMNDIYIDVKDKIVVKVDSVDTGSYQLNPLTNRITYTPNHNFHGIAKITYHLEMNYIDGQLVSSESANVIINVQSVPDLPKADIDVDYQTYEDDMITDINVLDNDEYPIQERHKLEIIEFFADHGHVIKKSNNKLDYIPNKDYFGLDKIVYTISDGVNQSQSSVEINVLPVIDKPQVTTNQQIVYEDSINTFDIIESIIYPKNESHPLQLISSNSTNHNSTTIIKNNKIEYTPNPNFNGIDIINYIVSNNKYNVHGQIEVTIKPIIDIPSSVNKNIETNEDTPIEVNIRDIISYPDDEKYLLYFVQAFASFGNIVFKENKTIIEYTPNKNFHGEDKITYIVSDNLTQSQGNIVITVNSIEDLPTIINDNITIFEDIQTSINVLNNDILPDTLKSQIIFTNLTSRENGTITVDENNNLIYTPPHNYNGNDIITYTLELINKQFSTEGFVNITIQSVLDKPQAIGLSRTIPEDSELTINLNEVSIYPENNNQLRFQRAYAKHGHVNIINNELIIYTPNINYYGNDSIIFTISDEKYSDQNKIIIEIISVEDLPLAKNDYITIDEDTSTNIYVLDNDHYETSLVSYLSIINVSAENGNFQINNDNSISYTPNYNFVGNDIIKYTIKYKEYTSDAKVYVTINEVIDMPSAIDINISFDEDSINNNINIIEYLDYPENKKHLLSIVNSHSIRGSVNINPDNTISYTPETNFYGNDTITYTISDNIRNSTGHINLTILNINDVPEATNFIIETNEDETLRLNILDKIIYPDNEKNSLIITIENVIYGIAKINNFILEYTPNNDWYGGDEITYKVINERSDFSIGTINVNVNPVEDIPKATNFSITINEDTEKIINIIDNIIYPVNEKNNLTVSFCESLHSSIIKINDDNTITYKSELNYYGIDVITYKVSDLNDRQTIGYININIVPIEDVPNPISFDISVDEDTQIIINILDHIEYPINEKNDLYIVSAYSNNGTVNITDNSELIYKPNKDYNGSDEISYTIDKINSNTEFFRNIGFINVTVNEIIDYPKGQNFDITIKEDSVNVIINIIEQIIYPIDEIHKLYIKSLTSNVKGSQFSIQPNKIVLYTPKPNYNGTDIITYIVSDGIKDTQGFITVHITEEIDIPEPDNNFNIEVSENSEIEIDVIDKINYPISEKFKLDISNLNCLNGTVNKIDKTKLHYIPNIHFNGSDTITYEINDGMSNSVTGYIYVNIISVYTLPIAQPDTIIINENSTKVNISVLDNDQIVDLNIDLLTLKNVFALNGSVIVQNNKTIDYTPNKNYYGEDIIYYTINDDKNNTSSSTVKVIINKLNNYPLAINDEITINEDTSTNIDVLNNDKFFNHDKNQLLITDITALYGIASLTSSKMIHYTPPQNYHGKDIISYTLVWNDNKSVGKVNVNINQIYDNIQTNDDIGIVDEDNILSNINILDNDFFIDSNPDTLNIINIHSNYGVVTINLDKTINYIPDKNFNGLDIIQYTLTDGISHSIGIIKINVKPIYDELNIINTELNINTLEDMSININILENISLNESNLNDIQIILAQANNGKVEINNDITLTYIPDLNFNGNDNINYTIKDLVTEINGTINIHVQSIEDPFQIVPDDIIVDEDGSQIINILDNDNFIDTLKDDVTIISAIADNGSVTINNLDKTLLYNPKHNFYGTDNIKYIITDGLSEQSGTVSVTVNSIIDPPRAVNDFTTTNEDESVTINILENDIFTDVDKSLITIIEASAANGTITINNTEQSIIYTPKKDYYGTDFISYTISDNLNNTSTGSVTVTIHSLPDKPVAINDTAQTNEDTQVIIDVLSNDIYPYTEKDLLFIKSVNNSINGSVLIDNNLLKYTPHPNFSGIDNFTYTISDGILDSIGQVSVTVHSVNDQPTTTDIQISTDKNTEKIIDLQGIISDIDSDILTIHDVNASNGDTSIQDNKIYYTPNLDYIGTDIINYLVSDQEYQIPGKIIVTINNVESEELNRFDYNGDIDFENDIHINFISEPINLQKCINGNNSKFIIDSNLANFRGIFHLQGGCIKNIEIHTNQFIDLEEGSGLLVSKDSYGTIENVHMYVGNRLQYSIDCGGMIGKNFKGKIINCSNNDTVISKSNCGGLVGPYCGSYSKNNCIIDNCHVSGYILRNDIINILVESNDCGGIVGSFSGSNGGCITIKNCSSSVNIGNSESHEPHYSYNSGSIVGPYAGYSNGCCLVLSSKSDCILYNALNKNTNTGGIIGGYSGYNNGHCEISNCCFNGELYMDYCGGLVGGYSGAQNGQLFIHNCYFDGILNCSNAGCILGQNGGDNGFVNILSCFSYPNIMRKSQSSSYGFTGNYFGSNNGKCYINESFFIGDAKHLDLGMLSGFCGEYTSSNNGYLLIKNCYSLAINTNSFFFRFGNFAAMYSGFNGKVILENCYGSGVDKNINHIEIVNTYFSPYGFLGTFIDYNEKYFKMLKSINNISVPFSEWSNISNTIWKINYNQFFIEPTLNKFNNFPWLNYVTNISKPNFNFIISSNSQNISLNNSNLAGINLTNKDFSGSLFTNIKFNGCNLENTNFSNCKFTHVDLRNTNLLNANLSNISIDKCCYNCFTIWPNNISIINHDTYIQIKNYLQTLTNNLTNLIGEYSDLSNISLHNMDLKGIDLSNAIFSNTSCYNIIFPPKYLPDGYISSKTNNNNKWVIIGPNIDLSEADLRDVNFGHVSLSNTNLTNCIINRELYVNHNTLYIPVLKNRTVISTGILDIHFEFKYLNSNSDFCKIYLGRLDKNISNWNNIICLFLYDKYYTISKSQYLENGGTEEQFNNQDINNNNILDGNEVDLELVSVDNNNLPKNLYINSKNICSNKYFKYHLRIDFTQKQVILNIDDFSIISTRIFENLREPIQVGSIKIGDEYINNGSDLRTNNNEFAIRNMSIVHTSDNTQDNIINIDYNYSSLNSISSSISDFYNKNNSLMIPQNEGEPDHKIKYSLNFSQVDTTTIWIDGNRLTNDTINDLNL